jgi:hypothetical protein
MVQDVVLRGAHVRLEPLVRAHRHVVVQRADQVVDGSIERLVDQAGIDGDRVGAAFECDGLSVCQAYALDCVDASPESTLVRLGDALHGTKDTCAGGEPETAELIREGRGPRKFELRLGDEGPSVATLAALEQPMPFELAERLPERHPADAEALGQHAFRGEAIAGR